MKKFEKLLVFAVLVGLSPVMVLGQSADNGNQSKSTTIMVDYNVDINVVGNGTVTPASGQYSGFIDLEATADEGYKFVGWSSDLCGEISPMPLVVGSDKNITATFVKEDAPLHKITTSVEGEGIVLTNYKKAYEGTVVSFNAIPEAGYIFALWRKFPEAGQQTPIDVEITDSIEMVAVFLASSPNTYYVSTDGDDENVGSFEQPFATIKKAYSKMLPGNVTYVMPGVYTGSTTFLSGRSGVSGNYMHIVAYDMADKPVIETSVKIENTSYLHMKGLSITKNAVQIGGPDVHHNFFEQLEVHHIFNSQIAFSVADKSHDNLFINCDFHNNVQHSGSNADGIALWGSNGTTNGPFNNTLIDCRSYFNNDDGFDLWWSGSNNRFDGCWAFGNGKDSTFADIEGDGNGFKLGQGKPSSVLTNCLAIKNRNTGFDQNSNTGGGITILNSSAYENDYHDFDFWEAPTTSMIRNCLGYKGDLYLEAADDQYNSWNFEDISITDADFISVDFMEIAADRKPDGSLPDIDFLHLADGSDLIDRGIEVGLNYNGPAPDLGAFEAAESADAVGETIGRDLSSLQTFPNPVSSNATIKYIIENSANVNLSVMNIAGQTVAVLVNDNQQSGEYTINWNGTNSQGDHLPNGIYINVLKVGNAEAVYNKMIFNR